MPMIFSRLLASCALFLTAAASAQIAPQDLDAAARRVEPRVIAWRRDLHQHPELSNREVRTAEIVAKQLARPRAGRQDGNRDDGRRRRAARRLARADHRAARRHGRAAGDRAGRSAVQVHGDDAVSRRDGRRDACVRARRAHRDPARRRRSARGHARQAARTGALHLPACRGRRRRTARRAARAAMLAEGLFDIAKPEAVFGLHVIASLPTGVIGYRSGPMMAGSDRFRSW